MLAVSKNQVAAALSLAAVSFQAGCATHNYETRPVSARYETPATLADIGVRMNVAYAKGVGTYMLSAGTEQAQFTFEEAGLFQIGVSRYTYNGIGKGVERIYTNSISVTETPVVVTLAGGSWPAVDDGEVTVTRSSGGDSRTVRFQF